MKKGGGVGGGGGGGVQTLGFPTFIQFFNNNYFEKGGWDPHLWMSPRGDQLIELTLFEVINL